MCVTTSIFAEGIVLTRDQVNRIATALTAVGIELEEANIPLYKAGTPVLCGCNQVGMLAMIGQQLALLSEVVEKGESRVESTFDAAEFLVSQRDVFFESKLDGIFEGVIILDSLIDNVDEELSLADILICSKISALDALVVETGEVVIEQCAISSSALDEAIKAAKEQNISDVFDIIDPLAGIITRLVQAL
jgi:hypothetical protein